MDNALLNFLLRLARREKPHDGGLYKEFDFILEGMSKRREECRNPLVQGNST